MWATTKEEQKVVIKQEAMERFMLGISLCEHIHEQINSGAELSKGHDHRILKTEVLQGQIHRKVHRQQVDPYSCRVVSKGQKQPLRRPQQ